ncbi:MAG: type II and III secretion system protein [Methylophilaceae bacterium]
MQSHNENRQINQEYISAKQLIAHGRLEEGFNKLQTLTEQYPNNPQFRNALKMQQDLKIAKLIETAEMALHKKLPLEAESIFQEVLSILPKNQRALDGLKKVKILQKHTTLMLDARQAFDNNEFDRARLLVRGVLAEDSGNQEAQRLFEELDAEAINKINTVPKIKTAFKKLVSLEFNNVPIKSVFEYIGKAGQLNFSFDREVSDAMLVSILLRDTPIEDAIQTILTTNQLAKKILNPNTILIYPISRSQEYEELYVRSFYLNNMDAKSAMQLVKTVLKAKDVYIDEELGTLVMRDTLESIKTAEKLIASQDLVEPEVMLEVEVMEVNRRNLEEIGIRYPTQASIGVQGADGTPGRLTLAELKSFNSDLGVFSITDPVLALNLLQQDTDTNLLANPKIRVKNRDQAKIHVGDKIPVLTSVANSTGFVSQSVSYIEVGIKLEVEPTILIQNQVSIKVKLEVSNIIDQVSTNSGVLAYSIGSRNADTTLQLKDGETQILAGLFKDDEQSTTYKVPGLSSLPLIGRFFTNNNQDKRKNEIVLLITPRILHNIVPVNSVYTLFPSGINHTINNVQSQLPTMAPAPQAIPAPTPDEKQADNVSTDQEFAKQILQETTEPAVNIYR